MAVDDHSEERMEALAGKVRAGSRQLQSLLPQDRTRALEMMADALLEKQSDLLAANAIDLAIAESRSPSFTHTYIIKYHTDMRIMYSPVG